MQADVAETALGAADVGSMEPSRLCEALLGETPSKTGGSEALTERCGYGILLHKTGSID